MAEVNPHAARLFGHAKREPEKPKHALLQPHEEQNTNLHPVVKELVHCGIRAVHAVDPASAAHAAAGWASELSKKGFSDEIARDATSQSIGEEMTKALQTAINAASPHEVASHIESLRGDTVDGSDAAVAHLLHQAHFDTGNTKQFNRMYKRAQSTAFANAARLVRARSELVRSASRYGAGQSVKMNTNEVLALIAGENINYPPMAKRRLFPCPKLQRLLWQLFKTKQGSGLHDSFLRTQPEPKCGIQLRRLELLTNLRNLHMRRMRMVAI